MDKVDYKDEIKLGFEINKLLKKITHPILLGALKNTIDEQMEKG